MAVAGDTIDALNAESNAAIVSDCVSGGRLFEDRDFPAAAASIGLDAVEDAKCKWKRPKEISAKAEFIRHGFSRNDISQGELGNCWILASLAGLAERPGLIDRIVLPGQNIGGDGYCGAFRFRVCRFGRMVEVMVDDRLPTSSGSPMFAQPLHGEFWVCLLEKALAKLYGSYASLEGGLIFEALADMTGGVCEEIALDDESLDLSDLAKHVDKCVKRGCVIGASTIQSETGEDYEMENGLVYSHAYTVTGCARVQAKSGGGMSSWRQVDLIRARNPWGCSEWRGKWSDAWSGWTDEQKRCVGLVLRDDGEFWMSIDDFVDNFASLTVLHLPLKESEVGDEEGDWRCREFRGEWKAGVSAGGQPCYTDTHRTNPQFLLHLSDSAADADDAATCLISLEEPDQRRSSRQEYAPKAVFVYEARTSKRNRSQKKEKIGKFCRPIVDTCPFQPTRTKVARLRLQPSDYIFVPCTYEPEQEAKFLLRVFTEA